MLTILNKEVVEKTAEAMAAGLAIDAPSAELLIPKIMKRLRMKLDDDKVALEVLDDQERSSAFTLDDLKKQIAGDPSCARVIKGSSAQGAGLADHAQSVFKQGFASNGLGA